MIVTGCAAAPRSVPAADPTPAASTEMTPSTTATPSPTTTSDPTALAEGRPPASVSAPAIGLDESLIDLGIDAEGKMEVPSDFDDVGWFTGGGMPGGRGPTVIAGHVDSVTAPAVFFRLHELVPGDEVDVTDVDGAVVTYVVTEVADFPKDDFPTTRVFGATLADELRLITCGGFFDADSGHYDDNRVVFATARLP
ncbi:class F sortase [Labedella endophytica]|uniref:Class F sortase n=2 Tax=Labedella endophytica TaxID=1523160 RepID=A0A3S0VDI5_9MICO|nr:class F sortase [Labedella endophytica]